MTKYVLSVYQRWVETFEDAYISRLVILPYHIFSIILIDVIFQALRNPELKHKSSCSAAATLLTQIRISQTCLAK